MDTSVLTLMNFARLPEPDQERLKVASDLILLRWPRPAMAREQQLLFIDDLAVVFRHFGDEALSAAIADLRQYSEYRPSIKAIRDACEAALRRLKSKQTSTTLDDYKALEAERRVHPERFLPFGFVLRSVNELVTLKSTRQRAGNPMGRAEAANWLRNRNREDWEEWGAAVRQGKHLPVKPDVRQLAAAACGGTR